MEEKQTWSTKVRELEAAITAKDTIVAEHQGLVKKKKNLIFCLPTCLQS